MSEKEKKSREMLGQLEKLPHWLHDRGRAGAGREPGRPPRPAGQERMSCGKRWALLIGLIGSVVFNAGWWIDYPPMVFAGVLLAAAGLDLWMEK